MFRPLLCAAAIFFLLFSTCFIPANVSARSRCETKMPETLLSLYQNSDSIYVATFDKTVEGAVIEDSADFSTINIKKHFSISSTLKGESRKFFVLDDQEYIYKNTTETPATDGESEEADDPEASPILGAGDTLLLFLKNGDEGAAPTLTDYRDGTKKLSMEHIGIYESRIKELSSIFSAKKIDEAKIVDWLVRCAEDPVTRWEGTFELLQSFQNMDWQEEAAEQRKARIERGESVEVEADGESEVRGNENLEEDTGKNVDTSSFAKLLDDNKKQTLANILLNRPAPAADDKEKSEVAGDEELIELVKRWGDPRLVEFLLDQLRTGGGEPYLAARIMKTIAEILDDKEIEAIAEKYGENSYEDDTSEVEAEPGDVAATVNETAESIEPADVPTAAGIAVESEKESVVAADDIAEPESADVDGPKTKKITYKELRVGMMENFLKRCEIVMTENERDQAVKSDN